MSWFSGCHPSTVLGPEEKDENVDSAENPALFNPLKWPANDMDDGLDLPTFDLYVKSVVQYGASYTGYMEVPEQMISAGEGASFNVLRRSVKALRKFAKDVEFQGTSRVSYSTLKPFIQELLVLHHPHLQKMNVLIGLVGFAWDIKDGASEMFSVVTPALDLEFADHGTLAQYLRMKPLRESLLLRRSLSHQILSALDCLHRCLIVHGDLKPENILICRTESGSGVVAKLSDFGHSLFVNEGDPGLKKMYGGTRPWNAPEWRESLPGKEFFQSDIYSAGLLTWACFSADEDPFNLQGSNNFSKLKFQQTSGSDQKKEEIETFKMQDKINEVADQTVSDYLSSLDNGLKTLIGSVNPWRNQVRELLKCLKTVFENSLRLDPASRSLRVCIDALEIKTTTRKKNETKDEDRSLRWWPSAYLDPRRVSPKTCQLGMLRGSGYSVIAGASKVARLSVAVNKKILQSPDDGFTKARRRDAAWFLFRSYLENYGVEEEIQNPQKAAQWLFEFGSLGMTSGPEILCFFIPDICERLGYDLPAEFPMEDYITAGLQNNLQNDCYVLANFERMSKRVPGLFEDVLARFRSEGLRRLIPEGYRWTDLTTLEHMLDRDDTFLPPITRLHIAASCGDIDLARLLVQKYKLGINVRESRIYFSPLYTALKFSQTNFVLWLIDQGVKAGIQDQGVPVLCFVSNFEPNDQAKILNALCQAGASVNDFWWFDTLCLEFDMLSFAVWAANISTIELLLQTNPSSRTCRNALQRASFLGRLEVLRSLEKYLAETVKEPLVDSDWESCLSWATMSTAYNKLCSPGDSKWTETMTYVVERLNNQIRPSVLYSWMQMALVTGDNESLTFWMKQNGFKQFLHRTKPEKESNFLEKSALEWAIVMDRKEMFETLLSEDPLLELEQSEGNFASLLHVIAQRDLTHGQFFCQKRLELGDEVDIEASVALSGATPLEVAVRYKNYKIADLLLANGARVDAYSKTRMTPLGDLINSRCQEALEGIKFLLDHSRSKPSFVVDPENKRTALHLAAGPDCDYDWQYQKRIEENEAILDIVMDHYGDEKSLNARDSSGFTALHHAAYRGCDWAVSRLLKAGADPNPSSCRGIRPLDCALTPWGLGIALTQASPNFNIDTAESQNRCATARSRCASLLMAAGGRDLTEIISDIGFKKFMLASFGFINNAKDDHDEYEPWEGEFPLKFVTKRLSKMRNKSTMCVEA